MMRREVRFNEDLIEFIESVCPKNKSPAQFVEEAITFYITNTTTAPNSTTPEEKATQLINTARSLVGDEKLSKIISELNKAKK